MGGYEMGYTESHGDFVSDIQVTYKCMKLDTEELNHAMKKLVIIAKSNPENVNYSNLSTIHKEILDLNEKLKLLKLITEEIRLPPQTK